jgi:hypothetical protein
MHAFSIMIAGLAAITTASPIIVPRQDLLATTSVAPPAPFGTGSAPSGFAAPSDIPFPRPVPVPQPSGDKSTCPIDGKLICNGPEQWGLCNWGKVQFQQVAAGTQCLDGEIVFAQGFGTNA